MAAPAYPRDFRGYGRNPPDPKWPGNARVAFDGLFESASRRFKTRFEHVMSVAATQEIDVKIAL